MTSVMIGMTVLFENSCEASFQFDMERQVERLVAFVCDYVKCPYEVEASVTMVNQEQIQEMNQEFRKIDRVTDVLSFPMMNYDTPCDFDGDSFIQSMSVSIETEELVLGDVVLCADVIRNQAKEYGHSELREFSFLVVHSLLHLFGYDHMEEGERVQMEKEQNVIMEKLNILR